VEHAKDKMIGERSVFQVRVILRYDKIIKTSCCNVRLKDCSSEQECDACNFKTWVNCGRLRVTERLGVLNWMRIRL